MEKEILSTIYYFHIFNYPPTAEELYTFLEKKTSFDRFKSVLEKLTKQSVVKSWTVEGRGSKIDFRRLRMEFSTFQTPRYSIGEYGIKKSNIKYQISKRSNLTIEQFSNFSKRFEISNKKLSNWEFRLYIKLLSFFPQIKLVGLSGSMTMMNAGEGDDIDLFLITARNRLFTGRFTALIIAQLLGLRRKRDGAKAIFYHSESEDTFLRRLPGGRDKVCLNLFFDESDLTVPKFKRSDYVAHEVLQMKPIINKGYSYEKFLEANLWVRRIFPNSSWTSSKLKAQSSKPKLKSQNFKLLTSIFNFSFLTFNLVGNWLELFLRKLQLNFINRHRTTEIITDHQLWFHPEDFGKKLQLTR